MEITDRYVISEMDYYKIPKSFEYITNVMVKEQLNVFNGNEKIGLCYKESEKPFIISFYSIEDEYYSKVTSLVLSYLNLSQKTKQYTR